jgi:nucleotide-binding universal stress UspA family protein
MNFKTILVHLDHSARSPSRAALAARWAKAHQAHLVGLLPTGMYDGVIPADAIASGMTDFIAESADYLRRRAEAISREFRESIAATGEVAYEVRLVDGMTVDAVVQHGRVSDLVVLAQDDALEASDLAVHGIVGRVLMDVGQPVLIVPSVGAFEGPAKNVVVAWNDSRESALALHAALPALRCASSVTIASFRHPKQEDDDNGLPSSADMHRFLERHGIQATLERNVTGIDVADALLSRVADLGADLLVMGGYGHSRLRELILGGVTRQVLRQMSVPVLMAH